MSELTALQESAERNKELYSYDKPQYSLLESFPNPATTAQDMVLEIEVPEFTSLCPKTGQPDFANIKIVYVPNERCVESKSLKLYMMGYRNYGAFHEACVSLMLEHLVTLLDPKSMSIKGEFAPRGGIPFHPTVFYAKDKQ